MCLSCHQASAHALPCPVHLRPSLPSGFLGVLQDSCSRTLSSLQCPRAALVPSLDCHCLVMAHFPHRSTGFLMATLGAALVPALVSVRPSPAQEEAW